jgi:chaperonin GroEL (HSP60 family)
MLKTKIEKAVQKAFKSLDSLAKDVTFQKKNSSSFDFTLGEITATTTDTFTVKGIIFTEKRKVGTATINVVSLVIQKQPQELNGYTNVTIDGEQYKFTFAESNDFVSVLDIIKEV